MDEYGDKLTRAIHEKGITQRRLSEVTGLDESIISLYCNNKRTPGLKNHIKICKALNVAQNFFTL